MDPMWLCQRETPKYGVVSSPTWMSVRVRSLPLLDDLYCEERKNNKKWRRWMEEWYEEREWKTWTGKQRWTKTRSWTNSAMWREAVERSIRGPYHPNAEPIILPTLFLPPYYQITTNHFCFVAWEMGWVFIYHFNFFSSHPYFYSSLIFYFLLYL